MSALHPDDVRLLAQLFEDSGFTTRDAALRAGLPVGRSATAKWCGAMLHMRRLGLVTELDGEKPVAWKRTAAGTAELAIRTGTNGRDG